MDQQEFDQLLIRLNESNDWLHLGELAGTSQRLRQFAEQVKQIEVETDKHEPTAIILERVGRCGIVDQALISSLGFRAARYVELHPRFRRIQSLRALWTRPFLRMSRVAEFPISDLGSRVFDESC